ERLQQFTTKKRTAPTVIGKRRQRGKDGEIARGAPKVRFHPPERHDNASWHVVFRANLLEQGGVFVEQPQAFLHTRCWQGALQVLRIRQRVLGLFAVEFEDAHQRPQSGKGSVERPRADANGPRV